jgi:hypothetical protein
MEPDTSLYTFVMRQTEGALSEFLFEGKTPSLYTQIEEALRDVLEKLTERRRRDLKIEVKPGPHSHSLEMKISMEQFLGMQASHLRFIAPDTIPDEAVFKRDPDSAKFYFEWVEIEIEV